MANSYVVVGADGLSNLVDESEVLGALTRSQLRQAALTKHATRRTGPLKAAPAAPGSSPVSNERNTLANIYARVGMLQGIVGKYSSQDQISTEAAVALFASIEELYQFIQSRQQLMGYGVSGGALAVRPY